MKFSFLGVGNMGEPLAMNLLKAGEELQVFTRRADCAERFLKTGAAVVKEEAELADCDVLCTCLPQPPQILAAVLGEQGLYKRMRPGATIWSSAP